MMKKILAVLIATLSLFPCFTFAEENMTTFQMTQENNEQEKSPNNTEIDIVAPSITSLTETNYKLIDIGEGFHVPMIYTDSPDDIDEIKFTNISQYPGFELLEFVTNTTLDEYFTDKETEARFVMANYLLLKMRLGLTDAENYDVIDIEGHPAIVAVFGQDTGTLVYARTKSVISLVLKTRLPENNNNSVVTVLTEKNENSQSEDQKTSDTITREYATITLDDIKKLAEMVEYHEDELKYASFADVALQIRAVDDAAYVMAGQKLQFKAEFANPEKVKKVSLNWSVVDSETDEESEFATINKNGLLTAKNKITAEKIVKVCVIAPTYGTRAEYELIIYPAVTKIEAIPDKLTLYAGSDTVESLSVKLSPEYAPLKDIKWTVKNPKILEIEEQENGTVKVRPVSSGKTTITVTAPNGKKDVVNVNVLIPVEGIELSVSGKVVPGGTVKMKASILPKNASNKNVQWGLDVGEDIATMKNGTIKIKKSAPVGTVIKVSCTAVGTPETMVEVVELTVAGR